METFTTEGPKVPFGDGDHVPIEGASDLESSNTVIVFKNIFVSCDENDTGLVLASDLIKYVTPFLLENESEFAELEMLLNPNGTDPSYNCDTFLDIMNQWAAQVRGEIPMRQISNTGGESNETCDNSYLTRNNVGDYFCKIPENEILNTSSTCYGIDENNVTLSDTLDLTVYQDQIKQLEFENNKLTEELITFKDQLITMEEHNETLQFDLANVKTKFKTKERQLQEQLQTNEKSTVQISESYTLAKKQVAKLEKDIATYQKEISTFNENVEQLEIKNKNLEDNIKVMNKKEKELEEVIVKLEIDIGWKDEQISTLEQQNSNLKEKVHEQQENINHYTDLTESLKLENSKIQEHMAEVMVLKTNSFDDSRANLSLEENDKSKLNDQLSEKGSTDSSKDSFWKLQLSQPKASCNQSLHLELLMAENLKDKINNEADTTNSLHDVEILKTKNIEYEQKIKELLEEVEELKASQIKDTDLAAKNKKSNHISYGSLQKLENLDFVTLQEQIKTLESDNNQKYIKIVDFMEEIESLKALNTKLTFDRDILEKELDNLKAKNTESEIFQAEYNDFKQEHEKIQKQFINISESEAKILADYDQVCRKNDNLEIELKELTRIVNQLKVEKDETNDIFSNLKKEYYKLKCEIKSSMEEHIKLISTRDELNFHLNNVLSENDNLKERLSKKDKEFQNVMSRCQEVTETKQHYVEQIKILKLKTAEYANTIDNLKTEVENLKTLNQRLTQDASVKKSQVDMLKKMIDYQNTDLHLIKTNRDACSEKMYALEKENELILKENKELTARLNNKDLEHNELVVKIKSLEELNEANDPTKIQSLLNKVKNITDINSNILKQVDLLLEEKEELLRNKEHLDNSVQILTDEKETMEKRLNKMTEQHESYFKKQEEVLKEKEELNSKLAFEVEEKAKVIAFLSTKSVCTKCSSTEQEIENLQLTLNTLQKKNKELEERSNRTDSFSKLQIKIERLEGKLEESKKNEKHRDYEIKNLRLLNCDLETVMDDLKFQIDQALKENLVLNDKLIQKSTLENKFRKNLEEIQKLQKEIHDLKKANVQLSDKLSNLKVKSKSILEKKDGRLYANNTEITELKQETVNLTKKNSDLERLLEKSKNFNLIELEKEKKGYKLLKESFEIVKKENVQLKFDLNVLGKLYTDLQNKSKECFNDANKENSSLVEQVNQYASEITQLEKKLEETQHDLQKLNCAIRENVTQKELTICQDELIQIKTKLFEVNRLFGDLSDYIDGINNRIKDKRRRLAKSTFTLVAAWRIKLESFSENNAISLKEFDKNDNLMPKETFIGPLDEEMYKLNHEINMAASYMDLMASLKSDNHNVETQAALPGILKTIKKFTLVENDAGTIIDENLYLEKSLQTLDNICPVRNQGCMTSNNLYDQILDTSDLNLPSENFCEKTGKAIGILNVVSPSLTNVLNQTKLVKEDGTEWTLSEMEEKFLILQTALSTDCGTVIERYQKQQSIQCRLEERFTMGTENSSQSIENCEVFDETLYYGCLSRIEALNVDNNKDGKKKEENVLQPNILSKFKNKLKYGSNIWYYVTFLLFFLIVFIFYLRITKNLVINFYYPCKWVSWEDIQSILKFDYKTGPPPT